MEEGAVAIAPAGLGRSERLRLTALVLAMPIVLVAVGVAGDRSGLGTVLGALLGLALDPVVLLFGFFAGAVRTSNAAWLAGAVLGTFFLLANGASLPMAAWAAITACAAWTLLLDLLPARS